MGKSDFFFLLSYRAWEASFEVATIPKASEATGLSPFNPKVILRRFDTSSSSSSDSESSALIASNLRKSKGLLRQVLKGRSDRRVQKFSRAFYQILTHKNPP
jgi:hypothetical protein